MASTELHEIAPPDELASFFHFLDALRESGVTNMFGAGPYLRDEFGLSRDESHAVLKAWMDTFSQEPVDDRARAAIAKAEGGA